jgi:hypothetical protein
MFLAICIGVVVLFVLYSGFRWLQRRAWYRPVIDDMDVRGQG